MMDWLLISGYPPVVYATILIIPILLRLILSGPQLHSGFPTAGLDESRSFGKLEKARQKWLEDGKNIIDNGLKKFSGCFQVVTTSGPKIVLPNRFADEIRNEPHLHFQKAIENEFFGNYPGFEPFGSGDTLNIMVEMVRGRLTQSLNFITEILAEETSAGINDLCGQPDTWTEIQYKPMLFQLVARISTRVFVGPELSANEKWLEASVNYATQAFVASNSLRSWPFLLRPIVHWFLPECRKLRGILAHAREIIAPVVEKRREDNRISQEAGEKASKVADTIGWMDNVAAGKKYDAAVTQIGLSLAAIHTTSELVSGIIGDLCTHPEWLDPLRDEMVSAIQTHGWSKKALHEMKLTDSLMKESQRHHFGDIAAMHRVTLRPITLSDGTELPKGVFTMVGLEKMQDPSLFPDPSSFKPNRFLEMRQQPGQEQKWNFVTTSPEHLAFGHGKHSCPGRFFAANEVKLILVYLLVKFDWKLTAEGLKEDSFHGSDITSDLFAKAMIKLREQDLVL